MFNSCHGQPLISERKIARKFVEEMQTVQNWALIILCKFSMLTIDDKISNEYSDSEDAMSVIDLYIKVNLTLSSYPPKT